MFYALHIRMGGEGALEDTIWMSLGVWIAP
jgi:hypothetical protein